MPDLFQLNDDQVIDWLLDQAGLQAKSQFEFDPITGKLSKFSIPDAKVEAEIDGHGMMVVRQEVLRRNTWTFLGANL